MNVAGAKVLSRGRKFLRAKVLGTFAPGSESSRERKFLGVKVPRTFASAAKLPGNESSRERKFHTMVLSLPGTKVLRSESSMIHNVTSVSSSLKMSFVIHITIYIIVVHFSVTLINFLPHLNKAVLYCVSLVIFFVSVCCLSVSSVYVMLPL